MLHKTSVVYCINAFVSLPFTSMNYWPSVHAFQSCNLVSGKAKRLNNSMFSEEHVRNSLTRFNTSMPTLDTDRSN